MSTAHFSVILHCFDKHVILERNNTQGVVGCLGTYHMEVSVTCLKLFNDQCEEACPLCISPLNFGISWRGKNENSQLWVFCFTNSAPRFWFCTYNFQNDLHSAVIHSQSDWSFVGCRQKDISRSTSFPAPSPQIRLHINHLWHTICRWLQSLLSPFAVALKLLPSGDNIYFISLMPGFKMQ